jgi:hydroxymethylpyrimidine/phosphomethylpyrimidine kinase
VPPVALTIAGSDSSGGAGIIADARTFMAYGVWTVAAVTAVTAQNAPGVQAVEVMAPSLVRAQLESARAGVRIDAAKTGMLGSAEVVEVVADFVARDGVPLVVDPVLVSTSGTVLLEAGGVDVVRERLLPGAWLVTPNLREAAVLTGLAVGGREDMEGAARALVAMGCRAALVTGGHLTGEVVADCLGVGDGEVVWLSGPRLGAPGTHGPGCVLSAAITAGLAGGLSVEEACAGGVEFVRAAIRGGAGGAVDPGAAPGRSDPRGAS